MKSSQIEKDKHPMMLLTCRILKKKMIQMNLFTKHKQTHRLETQAYGYQRGRAGEGWTGGLGLTYPHVT